MHAIGASLLLLSALALGAEPKGPPVDVSPAGDRVLSDTEFHAKLEQLLGRLDKTIALNRQQISDNPGAPFVADLYLQLSELLTQRADVLYYFEIEKAKRKGTETVAASRTEVIARATKEAIQVLNRVDADFPSFSKRPRVLLLLAAGYRSLDEKVKFKATVDRLVKEHPETVEAAKARLLLGEQFFDLRGFEEAIEALKPLLSSKYVYERNAAKYRTALCHLNLEQFKESLALFEQVIKDLDLDAETLPTENEAVRLQEKINLKREALIDSIRAYTRLYPQGAEALTYYSNLSPNEIYFQEVIEKLAFRYISINQVKVGIRLLRAMSERIREPQKVVKVYLDVLSKLSDADRYTIDPPELEFVLQGFAAWQEYFQIETAYKNQVANFFEKQVRDLGTTLHDRAKAISSPEARPLPKEKEQLLERAAQFYTLHLNFFPGSRYRFLMASNLGDARYLKRDYLGCGDTYLRAFLGEYGKPSNPEKLIQSGILCLQTGRSEAFYEGVRTRGLLVKSLRSYIAWKPSLSQNARIQFALLKAYYDQGIYDEAIPKVYGYMKTFKTSPFVVNAGELILDYYATRNDLAGLTAAANQILAIAPPQPEFIRDVQAIKQQAAMRKLNERLDAVVLKGDSSSGAFYLQEAMKTRDSATQDAAFQQALSASKTEGDLDVFMKTASAMLARESSADRQAELSNGMALENIKVTRYYRALAVYEKALANSKTPSDEKAKLLEQALNLAIPLRDPEAMSRLLARPEAAKLSTDLKARAGSLYASVLESGKKLSDAAAARAVRAAPSEEARVALFKAQQYLPASAKNKIVTDAQLACLEGDSQGLLCLWQRLISLDADHAKFLAELKTAKPAIETLEKYAKALENIVSQYGALEGTNSSQIDTIRFIRLQTVFKAFAAYLVKVSALNADLKTVIMQKASEAEANAKKSQESCLTLAAKAELVNVASAYCSKAESSPAAAALLSAAPKGTYTVRAQDPQTADILKLEKKIFSTSQDAVTLLELGETYYGNGYPNHAMATVLLGTASFPDREADFAAIAACSARALGLNREALFHLKKASDYHGLRTKCAKGAS